MKTGWNVLCVSVLLLGCGSAAHANPFNRHAWHEEIRAAQQQVAREQHAPRPADRSDEVAGSEGQSNAPSGNPPEEGRHAGKMTAEERRALRRQINEAGRDIYVQNR